MCLFSLMRIVSFPPHWVQEDNIFNDTVLYDSFYYLVAISMYVCEGGNSGSFSCKSSPRVKSVPDGPKARKGERQQKAEEIQQGICCANWNHHYYYCVFLLLYYYCVMHSETKSKFLFRLLNCSQYFIYWVPNASS